MAWPTRSKLLTYYVGSLSNGAGLVIATVPAGKLWLIKDWTVFNMLGSQRTFSLYWLTPGEQLCHIAYTPTLGAGNIGGGAGRSAVVPAGYRIGIQASSTGGVQVQISGVELS